MTPNELRSQLAIANSGTDQIVATLLDHLAGCSDPETYERILTVVCKCDFAAIRALEDGELGLVCLLAVIGGNRMAEAMVASTESAE